MAVLHPTESPSSSLTMGDRLLVAVLTAWSSRLHQAVDVAQESLPNRPVSRHRAWKPKPTTAEITYSGYIPVINALSSAMRPSPTEADDPDTWEWVETEEGHPELQELEDLLCEFDEMIDMLSGVPRG